MSLEQIRRALYAPLATASQRALLVVLADFADDAGGSCYPSQPTLVARSCLSPRHVRTVLAELRALHLVTVRPGIGRQSTAYTLSLAPVPDRQPPPGSPAATASLTGSLSHSDRQSASGSLAATAANPSEIHPLNLRRERTGARDPHGRSPGARPEPAPRLDPGNAPRWPLPGVNAAALNGHGQDPKSGEVVAPANRALGELRRKRATAGYQASGGLSPPADVAIGQVSLSAKDPEKR